VPPWFVPANTSCSIKTKLEVANSKFQVQSLMSSTKSDIMSLASSLGPSYTLAAILTLEELGLEQYPTTPAGKIKKNILKDIVAKRLAVPEDDSATSDQEETLYTNPSGASESETSSDAEVSDELSGLEQTIQDLISVWTSLGGIAPAKDDEFMDFADSITLMRYCDKVFRVLGKKLYLQDFLEHRTTEQHAMLLRSRDSGMDITLSTF